MLRGLMNPTSMVVVVTDAIAAALPALYVVLSAVSGIALLLVLKRRIAAAPRRRALAPLRDLKATLIGRKGEAGVGAALARLRLLALHDVVLADDRGVTQIDHLVRAGDGIVVIETKTYAGVITGDLDDREWMQRLDNGECNRLPNPRRQNYRHLKLVEHIIGDRVVPVRGFIVSAGKARFAGELAEAVVPLTCLEDISRTGKGGSAVRVDAAWDVLRSGRKGRRAAP